MALAFGPADDSANPGGAVDLMELPPMFIFLVVIVVVVLIVSAQVGKSARRNGQQLCRACGTSHPSFARFCRKCGRQL
jgi:hypothetical protein